MDYKRLTEEEFTLGYPPEKIFITSDLHLFHTNIIKYCVRPFDYSPKGCAEMTEFLLKKFDALPDDCLIWNFGDVYLNAVKNHERRDADEKEPQDEFDSWKPRLYERQAAFHNFYRILHKPRL